MCLDYLAEHHQAIPIAMGTVANLRLAMKIMTWKVVLVKQKEE
jgi:hypothetical protein